ncbi:MAG: hypothetical protein RIF32_16470 [Leptospirales bacterium]
MQTGGAKLGERSALPASGWFTRLLLRNTPIPVIIHSLLDELSAVRSLQFVEDRYMPEPFLRYLNGRGVGLGPSASFFLHDRQPVRGGLVLAGRASGESPADTRDFAEDLRRRLTHWLRMADRGFDEARLVTVEDARDFFSRRFVHYDPVGVLLWTAERSPIERWFGARPVAERSLQILDPGTLSPTEPDSPSEARAPGASGNDRLLARVGEEDARNDLPGSAPIAAAVPGVSRRVAASAPSPASEQSDADAQIAPGRPEVNAADPTEALHSAGGLEYQVVGRTRGPVSGGRKYHIRRDGNHLRIALLSNETRRLEADHALAFFDRLQFARDLIRAHRDLLRALPALAGDGAGSSAPGRSPAGNQSLSLELNCESGAFRCVAHGITPLFFRRKNGRLYPLPDSAVVQHDAADPEQNTLQTLKTVAGVFYPGDALLLMPGAYTAGERRELAGRYRELLSVAGDPGPQHLAASLGPWLDARLRGRGLLIRRP